MNIELSNGLDRLFQWDTGQKVKIPENVPTVHFKWGSDAVSFDAVDGWVEIPPELTQKAGYILLWTYREDHTLDAARIPVERRPKPDGYAYTPTEIKTWEQLDARITALEATNVQPNWDQNDTSAADYVRGRTHYASVEHITREIDVSSGGFYPYLGLIVGNTYRVWYNAGAGFRGDGEEFVCKDFNEGEDGMKPNPYVGNADGSGGPGPYLIFNDHISLNSSFSHVVNVCGWKIEGDFSVIKTLDTKYLDPDFLSYIDAINSTTLDNAYKITSVKNSTTTNLKNGTKSSSILQSGASAANGYGSIALGNGTEAMDNYQVAQGKYNCRGYNLAHVVGNGTNSSYSNAYTLDWHGNGWFAGNVYVGSTSGRYEDSGAKRLVTIDEIINLTGAKVGQVPIITAVDENGVPTAWEPVDMASGDKWEKIAEIVIPDGAAETNALTINKDINGDQFCLVKARLCIKQPKYTGESNIPSFSFAMINGKAAGRTAPLAYTNAFRMPNKSIITGAVYEVDVSGAQQIETVYRSPANSGGWSDDSGSDFVTYSKPRDEYARYVADTLWAKPITSIGGTGMLIYPGCRYVLYGVRT